jgi:hypothetical protein
MQVGKQSAQSPHYEHWVLLFPGSQTAGWHNPRAATMQAPHTANFTAEELPASSQSHNRCTATLPFGLQKPRCNQARFTSQADACEPVTMSRFAQEAELLLTMRAGQKPRGRFMPQAKALPTRVRGRNAQKRRRASMMRGGLQAAGQVLDLDQLEPGGAV